MIQLQQNISLRDLSTMRLGGTAAYVVHVTSRPEVEEAVAWAVQNQKPPLMVGGGSNIFWRDEGFDGLILVNDILHYEDFGEDETNHYVTVGAGENWDSVVARTVEAGLTGIEALSLVPGKAGATPIQNVGAYGQEIAQTLVSVEAYDLLARKFVTIPAAECAFGYRTSRFKTSDRDRFLISGITLHLMKANPEPPFYAALEKYLEEHKITKFTPQVIRDAVIAIRKSKLPDPAKVANNGSFFANPIIEESLASRLHDDFPEMPSWPTDQPGMVKIPAAWLIEQAGYKDYHDNETGMGTWPSQPLVLVNEHARSTADLLAFKQKIVDAVQAKFEIVLQPEPELLP